MELAARQHGAVLRSQLHRAGVSTSAIDRRIGSGLLDRRGPGAYVVVPLTGTYTNLVLGTLLIPGSAAGFHSAARIQGFADRTPGDHLLAPVGTRSSAPGLIVRRSRLITPDDLDVHEGFAVTTPARTLVDLAVFYGRARLEHVFQTQIVARNPDIDDLVACVQALSRRGYRNAPILRRLISTMISDEPLPDSMLEVLLFDGLAERGVSSLRRQFRPPWYEGRRGITDGADPASNTILEADGRSWHATVQAQDDDRRRDRTAGENGWLVVRVGGRELTRRRESTLDQVVAIIESRRRALAA